MSSETLCVCVCVCVYTFLYVIRRNISEVCTDAQNIREHEEMSGVVRLYCKEAGSFYLEG
jgi:hypothetical protein